MTYQPIQRLDVEGYDCIRKASFELSPVHALMVRVVENADFDRVPPDAQGLTRWLDGAKQALKLGSESK